MVPTCLGLLKKCKLLKENSKLWNEFQFGNIFCQLRIVDDKLKEIQANIINNSADSPFPIQQDIFLNKRSSLLTFSIEYWKQKSKTNYLLLGDTNSTYYHTHASIRKNRNQIKEIISSNGESITCPLVIAEELTQAFKLRFSSDPLSSFDKDHDFSLLDSIISDTDNVFLVAPVLGEEIKLATFNLAPDKAPGPDGFPPYFFQKY